MYVASVGDGGSNFLMHICAVGLGGSKKSISDPLYVSGYLPYRQMDRVCSFRFVFVLFVGAFDTRE